MYKILYIAGSAGVGGAETFLKQTLTQANQEEFQNHYLLFQPGPLYDFLEKSGARVTLLNSPPQLSKLSDHKKVAAKITEIINDVGIDLVHSTMAQTAVFSARVCKEMGIPHVWFQHGPKFCWQDRLAAILPHQGLMVNSHYTGRQQRRMENPLRFLIPRNIPIEKILLGTELKPVAPEVAAQHRKEICRKNQIPEDAVIISMLCRMQQWKGVHLFLDAVSELRAITELPPFHCLVWGDSYGSEDYKRSLQKRIEHDNLPVVLMGTSEDVALSLSTSDIHVNASILPEPFGLSSVEAMMVGCVPVVPDEGGPIEIINNGKDGLVFKARDAHSLARQLKTLVGDRQLVLKLAEQAKITAENKYCASRVISQLETFHKRVLEE